MLKQLQTSLLAVGLAIGLATIPAVAQDKMADKKMSSMDKMSSMTTDEKAAMFDKMSSKDKMAAMKMGGHDASKMSAAEHTAMMDKMTAQEKADMFDKMPADKKMNMMKKGAKMKKDDAMAKP